TCFPLEPSLLPSQNPSASSARCLRGLNWPARYYCDGRRRPAALKLSKRQDVPGSYSISASHFQITVSLAGPCAHFRCLTTRPIIAGGASRGDCDRRWQAGIFLEVIDDLSSPRETRGSLHLRSCSPCPGRDRVCGSLSAGRSVIMNQRQPRLAKVDDAKA